MPGGLLVKAQAFTGPPEKPGLLHICASIRVSSWRSMGRIDRSFFNVLNACATSTKCG